MNTFKKILIGLVAIAVLFVVSDFYISKTFGFRVTNLFPPSYSLNWKKPSELVNDNMGFELKNGEVYMDANSLALNDKALRVWVYDDGPSLPTYITTRNQPFFLNEEFAMYLKSGSGSDTLYLYADQSFGIEGRGFDLKSFLAFKTHKEDTSCGYLCRYDAQDKDQKFSAGKVYPPLPGGVDLDTFTVLYAPDKNFSGFAKDKNYIYHSSTGNTFSVLKGIQGVDVETFEALGGRYSKDKANVYYELTSLRAMEGADAATFYYDSKNNVGKDAFTVFDGMSPIPDADPISLKRVAPYARYFIDKNAVYFDTDKVEGAHPLSFQAHEPNANFSCGTGCIYHAEDLFHKYHGKRMVQ